MKPEAEEKLAEVKQENAMETSGDAVQDAEQQLQQVQVTEEKREVKKRRRRQEKREEYDVSQDTWLQFEQCVFECLGQAWPTVPATQGTCRQYVCTAKVM